MGLLDRLFGVPASAEPRRRSRDQRLRLLDARGDDYMAVVGESFYEKGIAYVTGGAPGSYDAEFLLTREPTNPHDSNCIKVTTIGGVQVGNLSRENAARFASRLDRAGGVAIVDGVLSRKPEHANWNVVLRVDYTVLEDAS